MNFQSINKDNYFIISNNPPIIFTDAYNVCTTLNWDIGELGIRLVYFLSGFFYNSKY